MSYRPFTDNNAGLYPYSSLQLNVPNLISKEIIRWGESMIRDEDIYSDQLRGREDEIHVTLLYGIHSSNPEEMESLIAGQRPFEVKLGRVSIFTTNDDFDVVKIETNSPGLFYLNQYLKNRVPHTVCYAIYKPHVTIAYVKKNTCGHLTGKNYFSNWTWQANTVVFSSKSGSKTPIRLNNVVPAFCS